MSQKRRKFTAEEKVSIIRRHLLEQEQISDICDELCIHPNLFYKWQRDFFENGALAFKPGSKSKDAKQLQVKEQKIQHLEAKLNRKNEVVSELMEAHIELKKSLGEL